MLTSQLERANCKKAEGKAVLTRALVTLKVNLKLFSSFIVFLCSAFASMMFAQQADRSTYSNALLNTCYCAMYLLHLHAAGDVSV